MVRTRLPGAGRGLVLAAVTGVVCLVVASPAVAHQPHLVGDAARVAVSDPEISKAYDGRLPGVPARYEIVSRRPFTLYAQITVADISGARRDYRLRILGPNGQLLAQLSTPTSHWKRFFEPFGGDHYLTGPEYRRHVPAGHYIVRVSRPGDRGIDVLAIGEAEQWGRRTAARDTRRATTSNVTDMKPPRLTASPKKRSMTSAGRARAHRRIGPRGPRDSAEAARLVSVTSARV